MDFSYSEEQQEVQKLAAQILGDQTEPEQLKAIDEQTERFDRKLWADLAEAGLLGVAIDEAYGGMGFGFETLCLLVEEVGRTMAPAPVIPALVNSALVVNQFGNDEQKQRLLPDVANGKMLMSAALLEGANENPANPSAQAALVDGAWQLNGVKDCVPFAEQAGRILLTADSTDGLVVVLLDPTAAGVSLQRQQVTAEDTHYQLSLTNASVATDDVLATGDDAQALVRFVVEHEQAAICIMATGMADKMMRMTSGYTSEREQFGRPVATFQAVAHRAADMYIDIECLRVVSQQAVSLLDQGLDASEAVKVAKVWCGDVTHRVSQAAQHLHGGIGVDRDYPLFRYCLWARQLELTAGSSARLIDELGRDIAAAYSR